MKTYRVHKNTRQQMEYKVYDPMFWIEGVICAYAQVSDDGNMCTVK